jgi:hypothetical protein
VIARAAGDPSSRPAPKKKKNEYVPAEIERVTRITVGARGQQRRLWTRRDDPHPVLIEIISRPNADKKSDGDQERSDHRRRQGAELAYPEQVIQSYADKRNDKADSSHSQVLQNAFDEIHGHAYIRIVTVIRLRAAIEASAEGPNRDDAKRGRKRLESLRADAKLALNGALAAERAGRPRAAPPDKTRRESARTPYGFTHLPLALDDFTAASTKASPLTPSSMVGKWTPSGGFSPVRAALIAAATSE